MDTTPNLFVPPAPVPRTEPPGLFKMFRIVHNNPIELWGEHSYREPYVYVRSGIGGPLLVANDPGLIKHILVDQIKSFKLGRIRQLVLRPILQDGMLTAENPIWKRTRKSMAPVFTPRHIHGFADAMLNVTADYALKYQSSDQPVDIAQDMTQLTYEILAATLFSNEIAGNVEEFGEQIEVLFETVARVDPFDLLQFPEWVPRYGQIKGRGVLKYFRRIVSDTVELRANKMKSASDVPDDFLTLLLRIEAKGDLSRREVEDNVITFIGAGHETTARALAWTLYLLANAPHERMKVEAEAADVLGQFENPLEWVENMPHVRAAFEEAMRLYPPAPNLSRQATEDTEWNGITITKGTQALVMPWTLHRHRKYWEHPNAFMPSRFLPENRDKIGKFQYLPFGVGPRVCIGASFALQEAIIVLGFLLSKYRFDMAKDAVQPWPVQKLTTQPGGGIKMTVTAL